MTESLSPNILASISNLINYSVLQNVLLDIVKTVESLSRDVSSVKSSVLHLTDDKVSRSEFNVFVTAMSAMQTRMDALDSRVSKSHDEALNAVTFRKDMENQLEKMRQQISELEAKLNNMKIASFNNPSPVDPEEIRKLHMLLAQKVDVDTFRDFKDQMLRGEQTNATLRKSIQDALADLNMKALAAEKYENENRQRQQQFYDTLKEYNEKLKQLEALRASLNAKLDTEEYERRMKILESQLNQDLGEKEDKIRELYNALRKKADIVQLMELEQIIGTLVQGEDGGTAAGKTQFKCLTCDRNYNNLSGATIDIGSIPSRDTLRRSTGSPGLNSGRKVMVVGTDGNVYQGRDLVTPPLALGDADVLENFSPPPTTRSTAPLSTSRKGTRPQSAKRT